MHRLAFGAVGIGCSKVCAILYLNFSHSVSFVIIQVLEVNGRILQMDAIQSRLAACFITNEGVMSLRDAHPKTKRKENETHLMTTHNIGPRSSKVLFGLKI